MKLKNSKERNREFNKVSKKRFYEKILRKNPLIIDVGANKGQTIEFFKKIFPLSRIFAFEPTKLSNLLKKKYNENKKVHISSFAIDRKKSKKKFYYHSFDTSNVLALSGFYKINKNSKDHIRINTSERNQLIKDINHSFIVDCISLDEFIKKEKLKNIDLLKIDTQGNELNVLKGSVNSLKNIRFIKLELMLFDYYEKSYSISEIENFLKKYNFKIHTILEISQNPVNYKTDWIDILFYNTKTRF